MVRVYSPENEGKRNSETCLSIRVRNPEYKLSTSRVRYPEYKWISVDLVNSSMDDLESVLRLLTDEVVELQNMQESGDLTRDGLDHLNRIIYYRATIKREVIDRRKCLGRKEALFYKEFFDRARDIMSPEAFQEALASIPKEVKKAAILCPPRRIRR